MPFFSRIAEELSLSYGTAAESWGGRPGDSAQCHHAVIMMLSCRGGCSTPTYLPTVYAGHIDDHIHQVSTQLVGVAIHWHGVCGDVHLGEHIQQVGFLYGAALDQTVQQAIQHGQLQHKLLHDLLIIIIIIIITAIIIIIIINIITLLKASSTEWS
jgi:hypothetical protein